MEQTLISRASQLEEQAAQRSAELQEREQQIADQLTAAREQADQLHAAAAHSADRLRQESEAAASEIRLRADTAAKRQHDQAAQEVARLGALQGNVRTELARLVEVLSGELSNDAGTPPRRDGAGGDSGRSGGNEASRTRGTAPGQPAAR